MQVVLSAALIGAVQLLLFGFCGLGLARLLLPARLRAHELTLAPLFGLALLAILGFYGTNAGLTLRQVLPAALGLAALLLALSFWRAGDRGLNLLPASEFAALLGVCVCAWLINIAPVVRYGALVPIGANWDVEFYLPLAEYLKDFSYLSLASVPANPLREVVLANPTFARAMGATYAQALADLIGGFDSWASWVPMLALLRALTLTGLYALLREGLGVRSAGALAGTALVAINSLLLWTTYNSFGMGLGGLALLPAALVCLLAALEERSPRATLGAGLLLGGLTCTYWPMLMAYAVGAGGMGLALLWERRHADRLALVRRGALVLAWGGLLGLLAHLRAPQAFLGVFAAAIPSMGITEFISPATILGAAPMPWSDQTVRSAAEAALGWAGLAFGLALGGIGIWYGARRRGLAVGLALACIAYLAALQFVVRFPYGFLRGASYINTLLLGLVGAGLPSLRMPADLRLPRRLPLTASLLALVVVLSSAVASGRTYGIYSQRPALWGPEVASLRGALARLTRPGPVFVSPFAATALCDTAFTPYAYALRRHELFGVVSTGYTLLHNPQPGLAPAYDLLARDEDLGEYGLDGTVPVWQNDLVAAYEQPAGRLAWLSGRAGGDNEPPLCGRDVMTLSRAQLGRGSYAVAQPDRPLKLYASAGALGWAPLAGAPAERELVLALASQRAQRVDLDLGGERHNVDLPAGLSTYRAKVHVPAAITVYAGTAPVGLRWAALKAADVSATPGPPAPDAHTLLLSLHSAARPAGAQLELQTYNPTTQLLRYAVEIYEDRPGFREAPAHYAWALFAAQAGSHQIRLDLGQPRMALNGRQLPVATGAIRDGAFFAALWVYQGEQVRARLPFLRFERHGGQITAVTTFDLNTAFVPLPEPRQPSGTQFGSVVGLRRFEVSTAKMQPGAQLEASLLWQSAQQQTKQYLVFVQLLDATNRKAAQWDGALGGEWWPALGWRRGQEIWQDIPLQVAADAPPGRYRLIAGVYDPATGVRLRLPNGSDALLLGQVDVQAPGP